VSQPLPFTEDQRDCLQEISNVAMGAAGEHLASFSKVFVELSIPVVRANKAEDLVDALVSLQGLETVSGVAQRFEVGPFSVGGGETSTIVGCALVAITESSFRDLAQQREVCIESDADAQKLLMQLADTITHVCLPMLTEQLGVAAPVMPTSEVASLHVPLAEFKVPQIDGWSGLTTVEINYHLEGHPFNCDLLLILPDSATASLCKALDALLV